jgi:hypothetical protein
MISIDLTAIPLQLRQSGRSILMNKKWAKGAARSLRSRGLPRGTTKIISYIQDRTVAAHEASADAPGFTTCRCNECNRSERLSAKRIEVSANLF